MIHSKNAVGIIGIVGLWSRASIRVLITKSLIYTKTSQRLATVHPLKRSKRKRVKKKRRNEINPLAVEIEGGKA